MTKTAMTAAAACAAMAAAAAGSMDNIGSVRLKGFLGERLDMMIERHVVATDVDYITAPFMEKTERRNWWQTEFWGKWMHASVPCLWYVTDGKCKVESVKCKVAEELCFKLERGVERILSSQEPGGYIGNYPDELRCGEGWDVWGMKYTMMGLLHYYDWECKVESVKCKVDEIGKSSRLSSSVSRPKSSAALEAAKKLCDYVIGEIGPGGRRGREPWQTGNWCGYASSSILEPVMWLYNRTRDRKYLDFATFLVKGMTEAEAGPRLLDLALRGVSVADRNGYGNKPETHGGYVMKHNRWKAYEMLSCYQGLVEYYEATGRRDLLDAAIATGRDIMKEEINLAGGCACSEAWFHGARKQHLPYIRLQETCVTTTWMRFCEKLLGVTGDTLWADQLERTFYNAYLGAMKADGAEFAGYTPLSGNRYHGQHHCYMHTDCCTANGPRGFLCFLRELFRVKDGAAVVNFYSSALVHGALPDGKRVAFDMYSLYPRGDSARIVSHTENVGVVPLRLRMPAWSAKTKVTLNGRALKGVKPGSYFTIEHEWKLGDIVEVKFDMPVVAHVLEHNVAFTRGPVLLARDSRLDAGADQMQVFRSGLADGQRMPSFAAVRSPSDEIWMVFSATLPMGSHHENPEGAYPETVFFCDYASAGNTWRRDNYYRTWFPMEYGITE